MPNPFPLAAESGRSHSETWAGCMLSLTTPTGSSREASRSFSSLSVAEKASRVFAASYFLTVEAPVHEGLDATHQRVEQGGYHEGGDYNGELGLLLLAGEGTEECLGSRHPAEVD